MNSFDLSIVTFLNGFAHRSWVFDTCVGWIAHNHLFKGGVLVTLLWWAWFKSDDRNSPNRHHVVSTLISCFLGMALARVLAETLPFRPRPLYAENLHLVLPYGASPTFLDGWSSFPSDHATLFFCLATGLMFVSKRVGVFALCYTALFIAIPRIYLGLHHPTDIVAGAIIGVSVALIGNVNVSLIKNKSVQSITDWSYSHPGIFYALFFLLSFQIADMFENIRHLGTGMVEVIKRLAFLASV